MILVIQEYLDSLRERGELDAILPDLLSQMGLTVFTRPGIGTRQYGVDVGAVGNLDGGEEMVYLFSIKAGDLTRKEWDGSPQALRSSLVEVLEVYLRNSLPEEHRDKRIAVCICVGGKIREDVRASLRGFTEKHSSEWISFQEWDGDRLARAIDAHLISAELLPSGGRSSLRKALALLDEPESACEHFAELVRALALPRDSSAAARIKAIRQLSLSLRILFVWSREAGNTEAAFRSGEITLLHGWTIFKDFAAKESRAAVAVRDAFLSIYDAYQEICRDYLRTAVVPHATTLHGLSTAVRGSGSLDVNLKLFDLIGRVGVTGLWIHWTATKTTEEQTEERSRLLEEARKLRQALKAMAVNNPTLFLPATEDQSIDLAIAFLFLALDGTELGEIRNWIREIFDRAAFALSIHGLYPCSLSEYSELLEHPRRRDDEYRREATAGSVLFPLLAVWAALLEDRELYREIALLKGQVLSHCTFQYWFPDEATEDNLYTGGGPHGATLTDVCVDRPESDLLKQVFSECDAAPHFEDLSAVRYGWLPLVAVACRHHRLPLPMHFLKGLQRSEEPVAGQGESIPAPE